VPIGTELNTKGLLTGKTIKILHPTCNKNYQNPVILLDRVFRCCVTHLYPLTPQTSGTGINAPKEEEKAKPKKTKGLLCLANIAGNWGM
jgi:hypothetical protein